MAQSKRAAKSRKTLTNGNKPKNDEKRLVEKTTQIAIDTYKKALKELEKH